MGPAASTVWPKGESSDGVEAAMFVTSVSQTPFQMMEAAFTEGFQSITGPTVSAHKSGSLEINQEVTMDLLRTICEPFFEQMLTAVHTTLHAPKYSFAESPRSSAASEDSVASMGEELKAIRESFNSMASSRIAADCVSPKVCVQGVHSGASDSDGTEVQQQASILCDLQSCETAVRTCPQCNKTWEDGCEDGGIIGRCDCGDVSVEAGNGAVDASGNGVAGGSTGSAPTGMGHSLTISSGVIGGKNSQTKRKKGTKQTLMRASTEPPPEEDNDFGGWGWPQ